MTTLPAQHSGPFKQPVRKAVRHALTLSVAALWLLASPVFADDLADVTRLLRAGQSSEAMVRIDGFLDKHPRDMQMRFIKGVVLTEQGKTAEAITIFTKLTEDHPDLPEPYNNLAVLFAASGQYDKARAALDMAIRTNPSYATAYENLGDIHAKLASQAYDKALQLDSGNVNAKSKLTLLRTLTVNVATKEGAAKIAASPVAAVTAITAAAAPKAVAPSAPAVIVARVEPKPLADSKTAPVQATPATRPDLKPDARTEPKPVAKSDSKPDPKPVAAGAEHNDVLAAVNDWADAWSAQDVKRYLSHYATDFEPPKGMNRKSWTEERTSRIVGKGRIHIKVDAPQVSMNGTAATVKFRQIYASDRLQADSRKTLNMIKQGGKWQIRQERTGS